MELQARDEILWAIQSFISDRKTSLQINTTEKMEDSQRFLHMFARRKYYEEETSR